MMRIFRVLLFLIFFFNLYSCFADGYKETLILLDSSGSMIDPFMGKTKIECGAQAIYSILDDMSDDDRVGLRTIGVHPSRIKYLLQSGRAEICKQTLLMNRIDFYNRDRIANSLKKLYPFGPSPLEYALKTAVEKDFSSSAVEKHIILITDGYETCSGDPCRYIKEITSKRSDITIDVIALGATIQEIEFLKCLSDATNGRLHNVRTTDGLDKAIREVSNKNSTYKNTASTMPQKSLRPSSQEYSGLAIPAEPRRNILYKSYVLEFFE